LSSWYLLKETNKRGGFDWAPRSGYV